MVWCIILALGVANLCSLPTLCLAPGTGLKWKDWGVTWAPSLINRKYAEGVCRAGSRCIHVILRAWRVFKSALLSCVIFSHAVLVLFFKNSDFWHQVISGQMQFAFKKNFQCLKHGEEA